jgi:diguanylate cyclase (GGDEF)-like protein
VTERQQRRVEQELFRRWAEYSSRAMFAGPLAGALAYFCLRSSTVRMVEVVWTALFCLSALAGAVWSRRVLKADTINIKAFRSVLATHLFAVSSMTLVFQPSPTSIQATLEMVVATLTTVTIMVMCSSDRLFSYAALTSSVGVAMFAANALTGMPIFIRLLCGAAGFAGFSPLVEIVHQPQRKTIELTILNERLVHDLRLANENLTRQVVTDPLTGLSNRIALHKALETIRPVGLLFVDIDHFKEVNDTQGHAKGDEILIRVANAISRCAREGDVIARLGGDEFVMLLDNAPTHIVDQIAHRVRRTVNTEFEGLGISVSIGGTVGDLTTETAAAVLARADLNLYRAKDDGRNRVFVDA